MFDNRNIYICEIQWEKGHLQTSKFDLTIKNWKIVEQRAQRSNKIYYYGITIRIRSKWFFRPKSARGKWKQPKNYLKPNILVAVIVAVVSIIVAAAAATAVFGGGDGAVACLGSDLDRCRSMYTYRTLVMILRVARNCVSAFCSFCSRVHDIPVHWDTGDAF